MTPEYDPDKALWVPSRRRFFVMSGLALAGTVLGVKAAPLQFHPNAFSMVMEPLTMPETHYYHVAPNGTIYATPIEGFSPRYAVGRQREITRAEYYALRQEYGWPPEVISADVSQWLTPKIAYTSPRSR